MALCLLSLPSRPRLPEAEDLGRVPRGGSLTEPSGASATKAARHTAETHRLELPAITRLQCTGTRAPFHACPADSRRINPARPPIRRSQSGLPAALHMLHAHQFNETAHEPDDAHLQTPVADRRCTSSARHQADVLITTLPKRLHFREIRIHQPRNPMPYRIAVI